MVLPRYGASGRWPWAIGSFQLHFNLVEPPLCIGAVTDRTDQNVLTRRTAALGEDGEV